jgi:hypothetical protein
MHGGRGHRGGKGHGTAGSGGARRGRAHGAAGPLRDCIPAPQGRRVEASSKLRRTAGGLHFFFFLGGGDVRRNRLWLLKPVPGALRVPAAQ